LQALVELARQRNGAPLQSREIALRQGIPQAYLDQLLVSLRRAGLVKSVRGAGGGYLLARPAETLTVAECLRPLSSELFGSRWLSSAGSENAVTAVFSEALSAAVGVLKGMTLAELVDAQDARSAAQTYMMHI
jgi:Rrf2 family protein